MPLDIKHAADVINSRSNPLVVRLGKLAEKKYRDREGLYMLEGVKLMLEAIDFGAEIEYILVREDVLSHAEKEIEIHLGERSIKSSGTLVVMGDSAFSKLSTEKSPEGIITVAKCSRRLHGALFGELPGIPDKERILILESLRDPGNLGTVMRSAAAFGIGTVLLSSDCADVYSPKTLRAAMGAIFKVKTLRISDTVSTVKALRDCGRRVLATALDRDALRLGDFELRETDVFVIGNEGHGLSPEVIGSASQTVFIPMADGTESLNAAVATSVCLWELSKVK